MIGRIVRLIIFKFGKLQADGPTPVNITSANGEKLVMIITDTQKIYYFAKYSSIIPLNKVWVTLNKSFK